MIAKAGRPVQAPVPWPLAAALFAMQASAQVWAGELRGWRR
jgi:hypothetical protein